MFTRARSASPERSPHERTAFPTPTEKTRDSSGCVAVCALRFGHIRALLYVLQRTVPAMPATRGEELQRAKFQRIVRRVPPGTKIPTPERYKRPDVTVEVVHGLPLDDSNPRKERVRKMPSLSACSMKRRPATKFTRKQSETTIDTIVMRNAAASNLSSKSLALRKIHGKPNRNIAKIVSDHTCA